MFKNGVLAFKQLISPSVFIKVLLILGSQHSGLELPFHLFGLGASLKCFWNVLVRQFELKGSNGKSNNRIAIYTNQRIISR